jgi:hypothetical protein
LYGIFVWARRALNSRERRVLARAVFATACEDCNVYLWDAAARKSVPVLGGLGCSAARLRDRGADCVRESGIAWQIGDAKRPHLHHRLHRRYRHHSNHTGTKPAFNNKKIDSFCESSCFVLKASFARVWLISRELERKMPIFGRAVPRTPNAA